MLRHATLINLLLSLPLLLSCSADLIFSPFSLRVVLGFADYANYYVGNRPSPGGAFKPNLEMSAPFDWSPFQPVADASSKNLTFATTKGMEQFGCCPKTAGDRERRVLFGWYVQDIDMPQTLALRIYK